MTRRDPRLIRHLRCLTERVHLTGSSNFAGEDVAGEPVTISWAINFSDPTIDTDGVYRRGYSNPSAPENGVIVSVRVGDLEQEDVIATTSTVSDRTAALTLYNNSPFVGNGGGDGMLGLVLGQIDADRSVVLDFQLTNYSGEMIDSLSLEQVLDLPIDGAYEGEGDDYADLVYLRQDLTQPGTVTHSLGVTPSQIQLNAIDPTEVFEEDNLALIGFPVESGGGEADAGAPSTRRRARCARIGCAASSISAGSGWGPAWPPPATR